MTKRVIFLDFDGVLNTEKYQAELRSAGLSGWDDFGQLFDPEAVENLKMILETVPDALLVINSSWKLEGLDRIEAMWKARGLPGTIHSITPDYVPELISIDLDKYKNIAMLCGKGDEVIQWIFLNAPQGCSYVILDDVPDFLPEQEGYLVRINPVTGITLKDAMMAIAILSSDLRC